MNIEIADKWLRLSERDLRAANIALSHGQTDEYIDAGFHCQQAVEKALKAYIFAVFNIDPKKDKKYKTHDLFVLSEYTKLEFSPQQITLFSNLNSLAVDIRYECEDESIIIASLSFSICEEYYSQTVELISWIKNKLYA